jgi:hypothetical protein
MAREILDSLIQESQYTSSISPNIFRKLDRFPTVNSDIVAMDSSDLSWGLVTTNQTVGGLAQNLTV